MKKHIYKILTGVFVAVFLVSGFFLIRYFVVSKQHQAEFQVLAELVEDVRSSPVSDDIQESIFTEVIDPETGASVQVLREYAPIYAMNPDLAGWLTIEGTKINYPVMHTPDRTDYYLYRNFEQKSSSHGCLYAREECDVFAPSDNITIYGHNMKDGSMFAPLLSYKNRSFYESHRYIQFDTLFSRNVYEVVAVFLTTATAGEGFAYYRFVDARTPEEFDNYISTCKALSYYDTGATAHYGDKLITLSTCDYSVTNGRLVVVAVLKTSPMSTIAP